MQRERLASGTPWEPIVGYSRAFRVGPQVYVSGTTATDTEGEVVGVDDPRRQTVQTLENVRRALEGLGASLADVVRTRIYVTRMTDWEAVGRVHGEFFAGVLPATSMVEVGALIDPRMLVEIEAVAFVEHEEER